MPTGAKSKKDQDVPPSSQPMTQGEKAAASMSPEERDHKINDVVKYLLIADRKKVPIKKLDINKHVLKEHGRAFPTIIQAAATKLSSVFGIELKELEDKYKGSYILVNKLAVTADDSHLEWTEEDNTRMSLVVIILSLIFMSGEVVQENALWSALKKFSIDPDIPHEVFGDVKKLLNQEFVRQGYIEMLRQTNTDPPVIEYKWGHRAYLETSKRAVLSFVSQIYGIEDPSQWTSQWQSVLLAEGLQEPQPSTSAG